MEANWDLHAVVRGCSSSSAPSFYSQRHDRAQPSCVAPPSGWSQFQIDEESLLLDCQPQFEATRRSAFEELHELCKPFFRKPQPVCWKNAPLSSPSSSSLASSLFERTKSDSSSFGKLQRPSLDFRPGSQTSKSKKRKNTPKKVCEVPAESVSSDVWAWRKYGQKPIKDSPFPRSYYRCSSSKGCLARKQVERNRSDPGMFIVTYTAEHDHPAPTHRNSLAGVTRQKQTSPTSTPLSEITSSDSNVQATSCSSPNASHDSPADAKEDSTQEHEMEDECEGFNDDMFPSDDFFVGLEGFMGGGDGGSGDNAEEDRWDPRQTCFSFPWTTNNTAAAAGGKKSTVGSHKVNKQCPNETFI